ncbi:MAG: bifunctional 4-hydroxy-2-oxoglutarate aldolase/2-dehydro-3-deoxy-phosphogluconate aldolase [Planctomycetota bacterium]
MHPDEFVARMRTERASAILRTSDASVVEPAMEAAIRGGFRVVEFTLNTPGALSHIERYARRSDLVVGAGTVLTRADADNAVAAGAQYLVSPVVDPEIIARARELGVCHMPGTQTPTEMLVAHRAGAPIQKLFPLPATGADYIRACLGPMPFLRIFPTSGVDEQNAQALLEAGAWAVGYVTALFPREELQARRFDNIEARARRLLAAARAARL